MKKWILFTLACTFYLNAQESTTPAPEEPTYSLWDFHPIHVGGNALVIGKADVDVSGTASGNLLFNKENAFLYMLLPISAESYFFPRIEWNTFEMNWSQNPKFQATRFYYAQFGLTFYTKALQDWRWIFRADYNMNIKHPSARYGLFSGLAWGSHQIHPDWHYHIGAMGYAGLHGDIFYPVIGFDYTPSEKWLIQAIFPFAYSVDYNLTKEWRFSLLGRPLKERFRTGPNEIQPESIFNYSSMGAEFNIHYEKFMRVEAELFAGYNFGGSFYIKNQQAQNALYADVKGAPYVGAKLDYAF